MTTDDQQILALLMQRDERALQVLTAQYAAPCTRIAMRILGDAHDAEEIWNDALMHIWNAVPPAEPENLAAYLKTAVRNLALRRKEQYGAAKRGGGAQAVSLDDLPEYRQPAADNAVEQALEDAMLAEAVNRFLRTLSPDARTVFVHHYGNGRTIREIAEAFCISQSKAAVSLMRSRIRLRKYLKKEGWL